MNTRAIVSACLLFLGILPLRSQEVDRPVEEAAKFGLQTKAKPGLPTLYLIGDSTMRLGTPGQRGWGDELAPFFDLQRINVVNQAIGGRSSRTYQNEGRWAAALAKIGKGDYVIIQFGHNDPGPINEKPPVTAATRARGSLRGGGEETEEIDNILTGKRETVHTFGWYLRKYAQEVKAKGATPILLSLVPRNRWKDGKVVRASGGYGLWAREAAEAAQAHFIDHHEIIAAEFEKMGPEAVTPLFADASLHASAEGARLNARLAVAGIQALKGCDLAKYLSETARAVPTPSPALH